MAVVRAAMRSYGGPGLLSLYRGYWAGSLVWVPWNAVYLSVFGWLESRSGGDDADVATPASERGLAAGGRAAAASAVAALVTAPIDHVKTRLQVGVGGGGQGWGLTVEGCLWRRRRGLSWANRAGRPKLWCVARRHGCWPWRLRRLWPGPFTRPYRINYARRWGQGWSRGSDRQQTLPLYILSRGFIRRPRGPRSRRP